MTNACFQNIAMKTYIVAPEHREMEWQKLKRYDCKNAL